MAPLMPGWNRPIESEPATRSSPAKSSRPLDKRHLHHPTCLLMRSLLFVVILLISLLPSAAQAETIRVASISFRPQKLGLSQNADRLEALFREAATQGAQLALAPEGALDGYVINEINAGHLTVEALDAVALEIDSPMIQRFQALAKELGLCLAFGFVERIGDDLYNCALFIDHQGTLSGTYHKMQFAEGYHPSWWWNRLGSKSRAFDTPFGRAGFIICNDRWNPDLARIPVLDGARFLMIPAFGSTSQAQDEAVRSRARENGVPVIEANVGVTLIVDGDGSILGRDRREEAITLRTIRLPAKTPPRPIERDRVESDFLEWRASAMPRRYHNWHHEFTARTMAYESLATSPLKVRLLPGHDQFTFSMYGCPGSVESLKALVETMKKHHLGNGFDPGPGVHPSNRPLFNYLRDLRWPVVGYANTADHQVKEGSCRINDEQNEILRILDEANLFTATQIGEWGYYFHNLSHRERWWKAVYGADLGQWRHLMKPEGLAGYDHPPSDRQTCYRVLEDYFRTRQRAMRGWNLSITGHSHYEAYAGQWGARVIGLELGENIAFTQSKIAFARGAARRNQKPWSIQVSPWFHGSTTGSGPLQILENGTARGLDAGHSLNFYQRMWLHAWFAGTAMVTPEGSISNFFETETPPYRLTPLGNRASELFAFMQRHEGDRGIPFTPLAIVLDQYQGYNAYMGKPWGILEPTPGDREVEDLFQEQLFPGSDHIHQTPFPDNPEASYLRPTPYGEGIDVQLFDAPADVLGAYAVLLLAGDHSFSPPSVEKLIRIAEGGTRLVLNQRLASTLSAVDRNTLEKTHQLEIIPSWTHPNTHRPTAVSDRWLRDFARDYFPVELTGDPIQFQINRNATGWVVELVHHDGVVKHPTRPPQINAGAIAKVTLKAKRPFQSAREWRTGQSLPIDKGLIHLQLPPGETRFVALQLPLGLDAKEKD